MAESALRQVRGTKQREGDRRTAVGAHARRRSDVVFRHGGERSWHRGSAAGHAPTVHAVAGPGVSRAPGPRPCRPPLPPVVCPPAPPARPPAPVAAPPVPLAPAKPPDEPPDELPDAPPAAPPPGEIVVPHAINAVAHTVAPNESQARRSAGVAARATVDVWNFIKPPQSKVDWKPGFQSPPLSRRSRGSAAAAWAGGRPRAPGHCRRAGFAVVL